MPHKDKEEKKEYNKKYYETNKEKRKEQYKKKKVKLTCNCGIIPSFNYPNEKALYCSSCKLDNMIDVKNKRCKCGKRPSFNYPDKKSPICCKSCKMDNMIDVKHKSCIITGCDKRARNQVYCPRCYKMNNQ